MVLGAKRHGEGHAILDVLSEHEGRVRGYVKGGGGRRQRPALETGNLVAVTWLGRLDEHLGEFRVEPVKAIASALYRHPARLAALSAFTQLLISTLPERDACPELYLASVAMVNRLMNTDEDDVAWGAEMVRLEIQVLSHLGFGLDLKSCAVTGRDQGLAYVSPNTGRAVTQETGQPYAEKLLPLPSFLRGEGVATRETVIQGFALTGFFIDRHALHKQSPAFKSARSRMIEYFS